MANSSPKRSWVLASNIYSPNPWAPKTTYAWGRDRRYDRQVEDVAPSRGESVVRFQGGGRPGEPVEERGADRSRDERGRGADRSRDGKGRSAERTRSREGRSASTSRDVGGRSGSRTRDVGSRDGSRTRLEGSDEETDTPLILKLCGQSWCGAPLFAMEECGERPRIFNNRACGCTARAEDDEDDVEESGEESEMSLLDDGQSVGRSEGSRKGRSKASLKATRSDAGRDYLRREGYSPLAFRPRTANLGYRTRSAYMEGFGGDRLGHTFECYGASQLGENIGQVAGGSSGRGPFYDVRAPSRVASNKSSDRSLNKSANKSVSFSSMVECCASKADHGKSTPGPRGTPVAVTRVSSSRAATVSSTPHKPTKSKETPLTGKKNAAVSSTEPPRGILKSVRGVSPKPAANITPRKPRTNEAVAKHHSSGTATDDKPQTRTQSTTSSSARGSIRGVNNSTPVKPVTREAPADPSRGKNIAVSKPEQPGRSRSISREASKVVTGALTSRNVSRSISREASKVVTGALTSRNVSRSISREAPKVATGSRTSGNVSRSISRDTPKVAVSALTGGDATRFSGDKRAIASKDGPTKEPPQGLPDGCPGGRSHPASTRPPKVVVTARPSRPVARMPGVRSNDGKKDAPSGPSRGTSVDKTWNKPAELGKRVKSGDNTSDDKSDKKNDKKSDYKGDDKNDHKSDKSGENRSDNKSAMKIAGAQPSASKGSVGFRLDHQRKSPSRHHHHHRSEPKPAPGPPPTAAQLAAAAAAKAVVDAAVAKDPTMDLPAQCRIYASEFFGKNPCIAYLPWQWDKCKDAKRKKKHRRRDGDGEDEKEGGRTKRRKKPKEKKICPPHPKCFCGVQVNTKPLQHDKFTQTEWCTHSAYTWTENHTSVKCVGTSDDLFTSDQFTQVTEYDIDGPPPPPSPGPPSLRRSSTVASRYSASSVASSIRAPTEVTPSIHTMVSGHESRPGLASSVNVAQSFASIGINTSTIMGAPPSATTVGGAPSAATVGVGFAPDFRPDHRTSGGSWDGVVFAAGGMSCCPPSVQDPLALGRYWRRTPTYQYVVRAPPLCDCCPHSGSCVGGKSML